MYEISMWGHPCMLPYIAMQKGMQFTAIEAQYGVFTMQMTVYTLIIR